MHPMRSQQIINKKMSSGGKDQSFCSLLYLVAKATGGDRDHSLTCFHLTSCTFDPVKRKVIFFLHQGGGLAGVKQSERYLLLFHTLHRWYLKFSCRCNSVSVPNFLRYWVPSSGESALVTEQMWVCHFVRNIKFMTQFLVLLIILPCWYTKVFSSSTSLTLTLVEWNDIECCKESESWTSFFGGRRD